MIKSSGSSFAGQVCAPKSRGWIARVYGWMLFAVVALIFWATYENLGQRVLDSQFFSRMSSTSRVLLGVPVVLGLLALWFGVL